MDLKISQLAPSIPLTGSELVEVVQGGVNVETTTSALSGLQTTFNIIGYPTGTIGANLADQIAWFATWPAITGGGFTNAYPNFDPTPKGWVQVGNTNVQGFTGNGSNLYSSIQWSGFFTSAATNNPCEIYAPVQWCVTTNPSEVALIRAASNGLPIAGFTMTSYVAFTTAISTQQFFMGFANANGALPGSTVPSSLTNMIGLAKDGTDTNLQFMINNGSGSASKFDLGVSLSTLVFHLLRLVITCDGVGNCTIALSDMEAGGLTYSQSYPTSTAKLPAASNAPGVNWLLPRFHMNTGVGTVAVGFVTSMIIVTCGFGSI